MTTVAIIHGYSAHNLGDGFLVEAAIELVREAFAEVDITLVASRPEGFCFEGVRVVCSQPSRRGYRRDYLELLARLRDYDLVVAVGGGYQRAGSPTEAAKFLLVHGPQLVAATRRGVNSVYLPQSIGPLRFGTRRVVSARLANAQSVMLRDDRSVAELGSTPAVRTPDLAISVAEYQRSDDVSVDPTPVLSVRRIRGVVPVGAVELAARSDRFFGYVQSTVGGNDDTSAVQSLAPERILSRDELLSGTPRRVVVAVRLHAALMAMQAGHYVIHLAYERKGFGAFGDLGLSDYVHPVSRFEPDVVESQVRTLLQEPAARQAYDAEIRSARATMPSVRARLVDALRDGAR